MDCFLLWNHERIVLSTDSEMILYGPLFPLFLVLLVRVVTSEEENGFFQRLTWLDHLETNRKYYGVAVSDVDNDGSLEWLVAGYSNPNLVLTFDKTNQRLQNIAKVGTPYSALMDPTGQTISACACDIDGDGKEEIYFVNTNNAYSKIPSSGDKLFRWRNGEYVDLYSDDVNNHISARAYSGQSVACIDRLGTGKYSIVIAVFSEDGVGSFSMIEMNEVDRRNDVTSGNIVLRNVASLVGIERYGGGRSLAVGPILSTDGSSDIFVGCDGTNFLFKNVGSGIFEDVAFQTGMEDKDGDARGVAMADLNRDDRLDIVYGNWKSKNRIFIQERYNAFLNVATPEFENSTLVQNVIVSDFDNDGYSDVFMNTRCKVQSFQPNRLFTIEDVMENGEPIIKPLSIGEAEEMDGCGTGAAVTDINGDGFLELLTSNSNSEKSLEVYSPKYMKSNSRNWIRIFPKTIYGAPARGALVKVYSGIGQQKQVIDGGSGYLCQMEPLAHFGFDQDIPSHITVQWPDGQTFRKYLTIDDMNSVLVIAHPDTIHSRATTQNSIPSFIGLNGTANSAVKLLNSKIPLLNLLYSLMLIFAI